MPKFVSGSSGHVYAPDKLPKSSGEDQDELANLEVISDQSGNGATSDALKKPSTVNKRGTKEKQKNSLDLFKEELKRLTEERDEQRNKIKQSIKDGTTTTTPTDELHKSHKLVVPVPLKPDPRCPTTLTLQVNLNPKDKDSSTIGSFDTGDPTTTNIYVGNVNPTVNENDLCDIFGKFGPLASIKIMWPRTEEEHARNRNSGFVAYMSRIDAERAMKALNGLDIRGYNMKLGWGKAVPLPQNPVYVPPDLSKLLQPPPQSGLPFNGQLHEDDIKIRQYVVPSPHPKPPQVDLRSRAELSPELLAQKETYDEFIGVVRRSTVRVTIPQDRSLLDRIHKTIEYVIREGPVFESIIIAREFKNPLYSFLYDTQSSEHIYYRWKLYSILHGDDPYEWRTETFRMFEDGPMWRPPPLNPFADGMPLELIEKTTGLSKEVLLAADNESSSIIHSKMRPLFSEGLLDLNLKSSRKKGSLGQEKRDLLGDYLRNLEPTKMKIGSAMMFCINHADAAQEIIDCIYESLLLLETPFQRKIARLFLVSDILHNCSAAVTNASFYRKGFQVKLTSIFEHLREYLINIEDRQKSDRFKQKVLSALGAWKEWTLFEDEFVIKLSNILLGIKNHSDSGQPQATISDVGAAHCPDDSTITQTNTPTAAATTTETTLASHKSITNEDDLNGELIDDEILAECLKSKGLSLRWYKTLELSDDEEGDEARDNDGQFDVERPRRVSNSRASKRAPGAPTGGGDLSPAGVEDRVKFKASKWETVDPDEVAEQVVTISKWKHKSPNSGTTTSLESSPDDELHEGTKKLTKRIRRCDEGDSSSSN